MAGDPSGPETDGFARRLAAVGEALDEFARFGHGDPVERRGQWQSLDGPLPVVGVGADQVMAELIDLVVPNGARIAEPGFWGFVTTGPTTVGVASASAALLASPQRYTITAFNHLEEVSLRWLAQLCGLGPHMLGLYSSGGSVANLVGLGVARQWVLEQAGLDPAAEGLDGRQLRVYASTEVHHTIQRAAGVLGLGRHNVRALATDDRQRIDPSALAAALAEDRRAGRTPVAVVATAGTTNTGAIDPLRACGELAHQYGAWFHVDGAYGLPGSLDPRIASRYDGLELADSAIVDPHKWLSAPVGVAATFVRDRAIMHRAFTQGPADYLEGSFSDDIEASMDHMGVPYSDFGVELSAPARGVQLWAILRELGVEGVRRRVMFDNDLARRLSDEARDHPRLESLIEPELSIACIRYVPDRPESVDLDVLNTTLLRRLVRETPFLPSATIVNGVYAIRPCFINPRTTVEMVDAFAERLVALGDEVTR